MQKKRPAKASAKKPAAKKKPTPKEPKQPLFKQLLFGEEKPDLSELETGSTTILDILSPTTVDTKSRDYVVVDGVLHAYLYVTGYGYSTTVGSCWLAPLVEAGEGISLIFHCSRQPREKILAKISQTTMVNRSRLRDVGDTRQDYEELDSAIHSGLYLKDVMNRQGEDFYYARTDQLHTLVQERYRAALPGYTRARTDAMLRQLRGCIPYFRIQNDIASLSPVEPDPLYLEAIDVMLALSEGRPQGVARSTRSPRMLSFVWGREHLHRFTVARLEEATPAGLALVNQGQLERILWLTPSNTVPDGLSLPRNQFLVIRQPDGTHRFYGPSNEQT